MSFLPARITLKTSGQLLMAVKLTKWAEQNIILDDGKLIRFEPHQKKILDHCFTFNKDGKLPYSVIVYSCPKKSGKTELNAIVQAYFGYNIEPPNEIITAANKREQAISRAFKRLKVFIERNPFLNDQAQSLTGNQVTLKSGTSILAIPNDASGEAGSNHGLAVGTKSGDLPVSATADCGMSSARCPQEQTQSGLSLPMQALQANRHF